MGSGIRWNSKFFANFYMDKVGLGELREYRMELIGGLIQNTFAATSEGHEDMITTLNHFDRQWSRFIELVNEESQKKIKDLNLDWNIHEIRYLPNKKFGKFKKKNADTDEKANLILQIYVCKREDYSNAIKKVDEFAWKYWKGEVTAREFLIGQHQMREGKEN